MGLWGEKGGGGVAWGRGAGQAWGCCSAFLGQWMGSPTLCSSGGAGNVFCHICGTLHIYLYIYMYPNICIYGLVGKKAGRNVTVSE